MLYRYPTHTVQVGNLAIGSEYPIRVQSMTCTDTNDVEKTVAQIIHMVEVGCELVRVTTPSQKSVLALEKIKANLENKGFQIPLVADVHFSPIIAERVAPIVDKVRINPGNYTDKKKFEVKEYNDNDYQQEIEKFKIKLIPLIELCKKHKTAIRIGTNHGSLSDRIVNRYGDSPLGMVMSALEFIDICEQQNFDQIIVSMKSSNTVVMISAYRLLASMMMTRNKKYPLHLGVTEAGSGEDGIIKSSVGIGTLLAEGLGDTIRVSLTEDPENEIPVAKKILKITEKFSLSKTEENKTYLERKLKNYYSPEGQSQINCIPQKKSNLVAGKIGKNSLPKIFAKIEKEEQWQQFGYSYLPQVDKWDIDSVAVDGIIYDKEFDISKAPMSMMKILHKENQHHLVSEEKINFTKINLDDFIIDNNLDSKKLSLEKNISNQILVFSIKEIFKINIEQIKKIINHLREVKKNNQPIFFSVPNLTEMALLEKQVFYSIFFGNLFLNNFLDGLFFEHPIDREELQIVFGMLQYARKRISKTEYISCPSCGRTYFDLQKVTNEIKNKTSHLTGVKVGIMGCIVNGPGEMADADFGYVGSGVGKIDLYKGQQVIKRGIPEKDALTSLLTLIEENPIEKKNQI